MRSAQTILIGLCALATLSANARDNVSYKIVDTNQSNYFDNSKVIGAPQKGDSFYGQDAHHTGNTPSYTDNGDGTITDNVTGLMWQKGFEIMGYNEAMAKARELSYAGYNDWRVPSIKEAYSLIEFSGSDVSPTLTPDSDIPGTPFIDTSYFDFKYGANGSRAIDTQMLTTTLYVGSTERSQLLFGVNFADGRIKGYGVSMRGQEKMFLVRFVRGAEYGINDFKESRKGCITDRATSLMWSKEDSKRAMNWQEALEYAQEMNKAKYLGYSDWRVPNAKELQSIVDYTRSPLSSSSAAIDPIFEISTIKDESGAMDFPFFWTSTTHENSGRNTGGAAAYVVFGRSLGNMSNFQSTGNNMQQQQGQAQGRNNQMRRVGQQQQQPMQQPMQQQQQRQSTTQNSNAAPNWIDIHGAGSQRSDPKSGDPSIYSNGHGPQGDAIRIYNYVRLVRDL